MSARSLTRRAALGTLVAVTAIPTQASSGASVILPDFDDPLFAILTTYKAGLDFYNASSGLTDEENTELEAKTWGPLWHGVSDGSIKLPQAETFAGAELALRVALDELEGSSGPFTDTLRAPNKTGFGALRWDEQASCFG